MQGKDFFFTTVWVQRTETDTPGCLWDLHPRRLFFWDSKPLLPLALLLGFYVQLQIIPTSPCYLFNSFMLPWCWAHVVWTHWKGTSLPNLFRTSCIALSRKMILWNGFCLSQSSKNHKQRPPLVFAINHASSVWGRNRICHWLPINSCKILVS